MISVTHIRSRTSANFLDNEYEVTGVPMCNANTILIHETLNDKNSVYGDEAFAPKPNGSSYTISVRGLIGNKSFADAESIRAYILEKLISCSSKYEARND
jgi:hypothetical protein